MSLPIKQLDDRTFEELFLEARSHIQRYAPQWTNHNFSDPGITLIDLFAWLAEMQIYSTDRITESHKKKFLKYLQSQSKQAHPATTHLTFTVNTENQQTSVRVPAKTIVSAVDPLSTLHEYFETDEEIIISKTVISKIIYIKNNTWHDVPISTPTEFTYFEPFNDSDSIDGKLYLGLLQGDSSDEIRFRFALYEKDLPDCIPFTYSDDTYASIKLTWHVWNSVFWQPLSVTDSTGGLQQSGYVTVSGLTSARPANFKDIAAHPLVPATDKLVWIRISVDKKPGDRYEIAPRINSILLHTVSATHGRTWLEERHRSTGLAFQTIVLENTPVLFQSITLFVDQDQWLEVDDFDASKPRDRHFMVDYTHGTIRFGDGEHGFIPPQDEFENERKIVIKSYRSGGGVKGTIAPGLLNRIEQSALGDVSVVNHFIAHGGTEAETNDQALHRARQMRKAPSRLISQSDIEALVMKAPGVRLERVRVLFNYHPLINCISIPATLTLVVIPFSRATQTLPRPSSGFLHRIKKFLYSKRLVTTDLHVIGPQFIPVSVSARVQINQNRKRDVVEEQITQALNRFLDPIHGGPESIGWPFGRTVFANDIIAILQNVDGVVCVKEIKLFNLIQKNQKSDSIQISKISLVYPAGHSIVLTTE